MKTKISADFAICISVPLNVYISRFDIPSVQKSYRYILLYASNNITEFCLQETLQSDIVENLKRNRKK